MNWRNNTWKQRRCTDRWPSRLTADAGNLIAQRSVWTKCKHYRRRHFNRHAANAHPGTSTDPMVVLCSSVCVVIITMLILIGNILLIMRPHPPAPRELDLYCGTTQQARSGEHTFKYYPTSPCKQRGQQTRPLARDAVQRMCVRLHVCSPIRYKPQTTIPPHGRPHF